MFTVAAAQSVAGTVYALDIDPAMVVATVARARAAGLANVVAVERDFLARGSGRPDRSAGYAMLFNILHVEEPTELLREAYRVLTPGGRAGVIHWKPDPLAVVEPKAVVECRFVEATRTRSTNASATRTIMPRPRGCQEPGRRPALHSYRAR